MAADAVRAGFDLALTRLGPDLESALADFFGEVATDVEARYFHPHPFTTEEAIRLCGYERDDVYCVAVRDGKVLAYAMLRGWDEGFVTPSLGLLVGQDSRGMGLGRMMMNYLHHIARLRGAERTRLKVHSDNVTARRLYVSLGYQFAELEGEQLVGYLDLRDRDQPAGSTVQVVLGAGTERD